MAYTTVADVKAYLGITSADDDALISALIDSAQAYIERRTGRVFEDVSGGTWTATMLYSENVRGDTLLFNADAYNLESGFPPGYCKFVTASGIVYVSLTTDAIALPPDAGYSAYGGPPYYGLRLLPSANVTWYDLQYDPGNDERIIMYAHWAYSITPPDDIAHACKRLAAYYYRQKDAQVFDVTAMPDAGAILTPQGVPKDVEMILTPYIRRL